MLRFGIDTGSKFIKIARQGTGGPVCDQCIEHHGKPEEAAYGFLRLHNGNGSCAAVLTGSYAKHLAAALAEREFPVHGVVDEIAALIAAAKILDEPVRHIVNVGAGSILCIALDEEGNFSSYRENSLCAAGTGSFLDEQMRRMNFSYDTLPREAPPGEPPDIATRCAVFAKSDLVHRQQEGYSREAMWSGLCRGVASTMLSTLFRGDIPDEEILFCGGAFRHPLVRHWVRRITPRPVFHGDGHFLPALGALLVNPDTNNGARYSHKTHRGTRGECPHETEAPGKIAHARSEKIFKSGEGDTGARTLELRLSKPSEAAPMREYLRDGNEVRVHCGIRRGSRTALGVDIGSTSTKCVLIDAENREVILDVYRKTGGDPLGSAKALFRELSELVRGKDISIVRAASTGSGRKLTGEVMGADLIINEITAHFRGARFFRPGVETVFEIGGQDSKYIRGSAGVVVDSAMNFVCAAGTGSFIEEQAGRLGFDVREIGGVAMGTRIPHASDRCTVFMEQDINKLLREGGSREEAVAGVLYSIAKNYLHRVVGTRPVTGDTVFFQGATARNRALVAAFELLLGREIVVSPFCHVMGALGAAVLACERTMDESRFRGLEVFERPVRLEYRRCTDCTNRCEITLARLEDGPELSWGFMCGREGFGGEKKIRRGANHLKRVEALANASHEHADRHDGGVNRVGESANIYSRIHRASRTRRGTIGIPMVLSMYNYLPLWRTFLERLGFEAVLSDTSAPGHKQEGARVSLSDFCFPMKMALAHIHALPGKGADAVFFPSVISESKQRNGLPRVFCPYVISYPSLAEHAGRMAVPVLAPAVDFRTGEDIIINELHRSLDRYAIDIKDIREAYKAGREALDAFQKERRGYGKAVMRDLETGKKKGIVLIGRPYNLYDTVINLNLPERFREYGMEVIPYECLMDPGSGEADVHHMYWHYGERILALTEKIRGIDGLYPVYFTNFGCGPDSFVLSRFEKAMGGKPYLIIELDEHASETGYLTRIEAFMDVVMSAASGAGKTAPAPERFEARWNRKGKKLWIPPMHEISARLTAACFRAWGFDSEALPVEDAPALEAGRRSVRGSECLPAHTTIGIFLNKMREIDARPGEHALFMPTAEGPCRFGQYVVLHRSILDANGYGDTAIFSPSSINSYMGMPNALRRYLWDVLISGDMLMKQVCKIRPYEEAPGEADTVLEDAVRALEAGIERRKDLVASTKAALGKLAAVPHTRGARPLVGIVGEIYVRCNPFCNNRLIRDVEEAGGEAWLVPISEWILYTSWMERYLANLYRKNPIERFAVNLKTSYMFSRIRGFEEELSGYLADRYEPPMERILDSGRRFLPLIFEGEAILTAARALAFLEDGAAMVVNAAPFGCMPGNITHALFHRVQREQGKPILTLFYDGESDVNRSVGVYLKNLRNAAGEGPERTMALGISGDTAKEECETA